MNAKTAAFLSLFREGMFVVVYVVVVAAFAFFVSDWHGTDAAILSKLFAGAPPVTLQPGVVPVDLGAEPGHLREPLLKLLQAIDARAHGGGTRPRAIAFDIAFTKGGGDEKLLAPLEAALRDLHDEGVELYGAFHFDPNATGRLDPAFAEEHEEGIYQYLTVGHTQLHDIVSLSLATYEPTLHPAPDLTYKALPLLILQGSSAAGIAPRDDAPVIIRTGSHDEFVRATSLSPSEELAAATASGATVIVGNVKTELVHFDDRTGFELLVWAVDDLIAARLGTLTAVPLLDTNLMLIVTVASSAAAFGAFALAFARLRSTRFALVLAPIAALLVPFALLALFESQLVARGLLFPQLSLPIFATLAAVAVATWRAREALRRDRLLAELQGSRRNTVARYDVFISYARDSENAKWVEENVLAPLSAATGRDGKPLSVFFDRHAIKVGYGWYATIVDAICESSYFIPIYSKDYFTRPFCVDELDVAMVRRVDHSGFKILPIARVTGNVPVRYASVQYIEAERDPQFIDEIIATILRDGAEPSVARA